MTGTVFYSWQSDLQLNRNLIQSCLDTAIHRLNKVGELVVEAAPDRALAGAAGAVRIDRDIEQRIDACEVFIGDVTIVTGTGTNDRASPNPNVLIETGRAAGVHGWDRVILAFNEAYGGTHLLPFDLEKNRLLLFSATEGADGESRTAVKAHLIQGFQGALKAVLGLPTARSRITTALNSVNSDILVSVRTGARRVQLMMSTMVVADVLAALQIRGAENLVQLRATGTTSPWPHQAVANHITDVGGLPGEKHGYVLTFLDSNW